MKIDSFKVFEKDEKAFAQLRKEYADYLTECINNTCSSKALAAEIGVKYNTFRWNLRSLSFPFSRLTQIHDHLNLDIEKAYENVESAYYWGSHIRNRKIWREYHIREDTAELLGLHYAEGDNSQSKIRITNSNQEVILFIRTVLQETFPNIKPKIVAIDPVNSKPGEKSIPVDLRCTGKYNKVTKYRVTIDSKIHCTLLNEMSRILRENIMESSVLAIRWAQGMLAGEGTVRNARERYMRVEMKDEYAIKLLGAIFDMQRIPHKISEREDRPGMWVLYVGAKDLSKLHKQIGFGCHTERDERLRLASSRG